MMTTRAIQGAMGVLIAMWVAVAPCAAQQADAYAGAWTGTIDAGGQSIRLVFHLTVDDDGQLQGKMDVPDQGAFDIPIASIALDGAEIELGLNLPGDASYSGALDASGERITGAFSQGGGSLPLVLTRSDQRTEPSRPQTPVEPYPYHTERITFRNAHADIELAGTLTIPRGDGPFPGVALISGAGPHDRDASMMGHKPFLVLADHLTRQGVAVLRYDDRGVGASAGRFEDATPADFASDAIAAANYLRDHQRVHDQRVGVLGHSEGAIVAMIAADESERIAFLVTLAGPAAPGLESLLSSTETTGRVLGRPQSVVEANLRIFQTIGRIVIEERDRGVAEQRMHAAIKRQLAELDPSTRAALGFSPAVVEQLVNEFNLPNTRFVLALDPIPVLERIGVPVLALYGGRDPLTPHTLHAPRARAALAGAEHANATVKTLDGLNHLFQEARTGSPAEFGQIEQTMSPAALDAVSSWIMQAHK